MKPKHQIDGFAEQYQLALFQWQRILHQCETGTPLYAPPMDVEEDLSVGNEHSSAEPSTDAIHRCAMGMSVDESVQVSLRHDRRAVGECRGEAIHPSFVENALDIPRRLVDSPDPQRHWTKKCFGDEHEEAEANSSRTLKRLRASDEVEENQPIPLSDSGGSPLAQDHSMDFCNSMLDTFNKAWREEHEQSFESEAARAKIAPVIAVEAASYALSLLLAGKGERSCLPWTVKYAEPVWSGTPFAQEQNRLRKWLRTWKSDQVGEAESCCDDIVENITFDSTCAVTDDEFALIYDDRGARLSARIARKEAADKCKADAAERSRQKLKGYFSKDTSNLRTVSANGGVGSTTNIAVLCGPCGVGKTAVVYSAAGLMGFRVVEINTSMKRCPKLIEATFKEVTQSRQLNIRSGEAARQELLKLRKSSIQRKSREDELRRAAETAQRNAGAQQMKASHQRTCDAKKREKRQVGIRKENALSKSALAKFFKGKTTDPCGASTNGADDDVIVEVDGATEPQQLKCLTAVVVEDIDSPATDASSPLKSDNERLPIILLESAEVAMDDEQQRAFFTMVRQMAAESKFPIVVTANEMTPSQAASYFGQGTPHAQMMGPPKYAQLLQVMIVSSIELGVLELAATPTTEYVRVRDAESFGKISETCWELIFGVGGTNRSGGDIRRLLLEAQWLMIAPLGCPSKSRLGDPPALGVEFDARLRSVLDCYCGTSQRIAIDSATSSFYQYSNFFDYSDIAQQFDCERDDQDLENPLAEVAPPDFFAPDPLPGVHRKLIGIVQSLLPRRNIGRSISAMSPYALTDAMSMSSALAVPKRPYRGAALASGAMAATGT
jgi:hypothetical protein